MNKQFKRIFSVAAITLLYSCATFKPIYHNENYADPKTLNAQFAYFDVEPSQIKVSVEKNYRKDFKLAENQEVSEHIAELFNTTTKEYLRTFMVRSNYTESGIDSYRLSEEDYETIDKVFEKNTKTTFPISVKSIANEAIREHNPDIGFALFISNIEFGFELSTGAAPMVIGAGGAVSFGAAPTSRGLKLSYQYAIKDIVSNELVSYGILHSVVGANWYTTSRDWTTLINRNTRQLMKELNIHYCQTMDVFPQEKNCFDYAKRGKRVPKEEISRVKK